MALQGYITDTDKVKKLGNLAAIIEDEKLEPFFPQARKEMKKFIGDETYELFASSEEWDADADYDESDTELIKTAEAYLVLSYAVGPMNLDSSGAGFVKSIGFGDNKKEVLSETDIKAISQKYREYAEEILEDYLPELDMDDDCNQGQVIAGSLKMTAI